MGLSIGTASLKLVANADNLAKGLDGAYATVQGFRKKAEAAVKSLSLAPLTSSIPLIGGPLGAAFAVATGGAKLFGDAVGRVRELSDIGKQAKTLGIAAGEYMGLSAAAKTAGLDQDQFNTLLLKGSANIASGSAAAAKALGTIGMSLADVQGLSADQQFYKIADGLKGVTDAGTKALVAQELFGKGAYDLLPVLNKGGDGLKAFVDQQKAMGAALSDKDMASVERAKAAIPKIQAAFDGLFNRVVVAMAPLIETVGTVFGKIIGRLQPVFDWIGRAAEAYFAIVGPLVEDVIDVVADAMETVGGFFGSIFGLAGELPSVGEVITNVFKGVGKGIAYVVDTVRAFGGGLAYVASFAVQAFGSVVKAIGELIEVAADLPAELGGDMFKGAAAKVKQFGSDAKATAAGMRGWGERQMDAFGNSAQQVDAWFNKLKKKKEEVAAVNALSAEAAAVANSPLKYLGAAAVTQGSKEDYSIRAKWDFEGTKLQTEQQKANQLLGQIKAGIDGVKSAIGAIPGIPEV